MFEDMLPIIIASFVSGLTGSIMGSVAAIIGMRVDIRWLREQVKVLHQRVTDNRQFTQETRDIALSNRRNNP